MDDGRSYGQRRVGVACFEADAGKGVEQGHILRVHIAMLASIAIEFCRYEAMSVLQQELGIWMDHQIRLCGYLHSSKEILHRYVKVFSVDRALGRGIELTRHIET